MKRQFDVIKRIDSNQLFLPALQRKFVWKTEQIEGLFDSIMQGYPIGTFLFWELNDKMQFKIIYFMNLLIIIMNVILEMKKLNCQVEIKSLAYWMVSND